MCQFERQVGSCQLQRPAVVGQALASHQHRGAFPQPEAGGDLGRGGGSAALHLDGRPTVGCVDSEGCGPAAPPSPRQQLVGGAQDRCACADEDPASLLRVEQAFGLQLSDRLADGLAGGAIGLHEGVLGREPLPGRQLVVEDLLAQLVSDLQIERPGAPSTHG
jgi:hypothetical protein